MKEDFIDIKKELELVISNFEYLYSGDIISSKDEKLSDNLIIKKPSINLLKKVIDNIYNISINNMINSINSSNKINANFDKGLNHIDSLFNELPIGFKWKYVFLSNGLNYKKIPNSKNNLFPDYYYRKIKNIPDKLNYGNVKVYNLPEHHTIKDEYNIYVVDNPIQSLVYVMQNMKYEILKNGLHSVEYNYYICDYICYNISIKDIKKLRSDKFKNLLK